MNSTPAMVGGSGLPIAEAVRFVTVARRLCMEAFETLGRRSVNATTLADRVGVAAASRQLGETLPLFDALLPDSVGLRALADDVGSTLEDDAFFASFRASLEADPLAEVACSFLLALRREVEAMVSTSSSVADAEFVVIVEMIDVRLRAALVALAAPGTVSSDHFPLPALREGRKSFSSPLLVPNVTTPTTGRGQKRSGHPL